MNLKTGMRDLRILHPFLLWEGGFSPCRQWNGMMLKGEKEWQGSTKKESKKMMLKVKKLNFIALKG